MRKVSMTSVLVMITAMIFAFAVPASANDAGAPLLLPDLVSFSTGISLVFQTGYEENADYESYYYQCETNQVENVVQEYIRELRKSGLFIRESEKTVYDSDTNDANYGIALRDMKPGRTKFKWKDPAYNWTFDNVSIVILFSTGGNYENQYVTVCYSKGNYKTTDTGARMRTDRSFCPADYYFYRDQLTDTQKTAYDYLLSKA